MDCFIRSSGLSVGPEAQPDMKKTSNGIKITLNIDVPSLNIPDTQDMFNRIPHRSPPLPLVREGLSDRMAASCFAP